MIKAGSRVSPARLRAWATTKGDFSLLCYPCYGAVWWILCSSYRLCNLSVNASFEKYAFLLRVWKENHNNYFYLFIFFLKKRKKNKKKKGEWVERLRVKEKKGEWGWWVNVWRGKVEWVEWFKMGSEKTTFIINC